MLHLASSRIWFRWVRRYPSFVRGRVLAARNDSSQPHQARFGPDVSVSEGPMLHRVGATVHHSSMLLFLALRSLRRFWVISAQMVVAARVSPNPTQKIWADHLIQQQSSDGRQDAGSHTRQGVQLCAPTTDCRALRLPANDRPRLVREPTNCSAASGINLCKHTHLTDPDLKYSRSSIICSFTPVISDEGVCRLLGQ